MVAERKQNYSYNRPDLRIVGRPTTESYLPHGREVVGSAAFNLEYFSYATEGEVHDDIVSYLGEYRFNLPKFEYQLDYGRDAEGQIGLMDPHRRELMKKKALRSIEERKKNNLPTHREENEAKGLEKLDTALLFAREGDSVVWGSPPGPKEEGYGDYGFVFYGTIKRNEDGHKQLSMTAYRVDNPTLSSYNSFMSQVKGEEIEYKHEDEFLKSAEHIPGGIDLRIFNMILRKHFSFMEEGQQGEVFRNAIDHLNPVIQDVVRVIKNGTPEEKIRSFQALENYALVLKSRLSKDKNEIILHEDEVPKVRLIDIQHRYDFTPPPVAGSCGKTGNSSNIFNKGVNNLINSLSNEQEWFTCPKCSYKADGPVGNSCPGCGLTKEDYAEQTGVSCD